MMPYIESVTNAYPTGEPVGQNRQAGCDRPTL